MKTRLIHVMSSTVEINEEKAKLIARATELMYLFKGRSWTVTSVLSLETGINTEELKWVVSVAKEYSIEYPAIELGNWV